MERKISIIVPVYNAEKYIKQTVEAIPERKYRKHYKTDL